MHRGSFVIRFLFALLLLGGVVMAVNSAYRSGFALGYMTSEANDGATEPGEVPTVAGPFGPAIAGPWGLKPHGGFSPFWLLFFGFAVFFILSRMGHRHRHYVHGPDRAAPWAHHRGPGGCGPGAWDRPGGQADAPREKTPEDIL